MDLIPINYYLQLYDVVNDEMFFVNDGFFSPDAFTVNVTPYSIEHITINFNIFEPLDNWAKITLNYNNTGLFNKNSFILDYIKKGNIIVIYEATPTNDGYQVFTGRISRVVPNLNGQTGLKIDLICGSLLSQLNYQSTINTFQDVTSLIAGKTLTDYAAQKVPFGAILSFMTSESLMSLAINKGIIPATNFYQGIPIPFLIIDNLDTNISIDSLVFYYANNDSSRIISLLETVMAYQLIMYQGLDGVIYITQPTINVGISEPYSFDISDVGSLAEDTLLYTGFSFDDNSDVVNQSYASIINTGFNLNEINNNINNNIISSTSIIENPDGLFSRLTDLYKTGYYTNTRHQTVPLNNNIATDPLLLNLLSKMANNTKQINLSGDKNTSTIAGLYAAKIMANSLFNEFKMQINMARAACVNKKISNGLLELPIGKTILVDDGEKNRWGLETKNYYCYGFLLNTNANSTGHALSLKLCKPYTFTPAWNTEISI